MYTGRRYMGTVCAHIPSPNDLTHTFFDEQYLLEYHHTACIKSRDSRALLGGWFAYCTCP